MNEKTAYLFDKTESQINNVYEEISILSKKKPDAPINKFKLKLINNLINQANGMLGDEYSPFQEFNEFNEDDLPSTSDVVFILSPVFK